MLVRCGLQQSSIWNNSRVIYVYSRGSGIRDRVSAIFRLSGIHIL